MTEEKQVDVDDDRDGSIRERIVEQFSYEGEHADVWRVFDRVLPTRAYLNLGYARWYQPFPLGSQRRLAERVGAGLADRLPATAGVRLLDLGCGRGGPAVGFALAHGFDVVGVDLVPYNVSLARANAAERDATAAFLVGDAAQLPFADGAFGACTAVDTLVYVPEKRRVFAELARVLEEGGVLAAPDLLRREDLPPDAAAAVAAFADAWDMPPLVTLADYRRSLEEAGFAVETVVDITANSTGRYRTWSWLALALADGPLGGAVERVLGRWGIDEEALVEQVRRAHAALPYLRHVLVYARR